MGIPTPTVPLRRRGHFSFHGKFIIRDKSDFSNYYWGMPLTGRQLALYLVSKVAPMEIVSMIRSFYNKQKKLDCGYKCYNCEIRFDTLAITRTEYYRYWQTCCIDECNRMFCKKCLDVSYDES